eukprot:SAG11_NODE_21111_length_432_cov_0.615616_1_plen_108_part_10
MLSIVALSGRVAGVELLVEAADTLLADRRPLRAHPLELRQPGRGCHCAESDGHEHHAGGRGLRHQAEYCRAVVGRGAEPLVRRQHLSHPRDRKPELPLRRPGPERPPL